jgi:beta-hydroxylase
MSKQLNNSMDRFLNDPTIAAGYKNYHTIRTNAINNLLNEDVNGLLDMLEENYEELKNEFYSNVSKKDYLVYPLTHLYEWGWDVVGLRYQGGDVKKNHKKFPTLSKIVKKYSNITELAGYSLLKAGAVIGVHRDSREMVTCHLGIDVPEGDCMFRVGKIYKKWENGKTHMFYSYDLHEAWNKTDKDRIILIFDLRKKSPFVMYLRKLLHNRVFLFIRHSIFKIIFRTKK